MTPLHDQLVRQIRSTGPITIAEYMGVALTHPAHGYYTTRDPLGVDFTTAPEISQMFGELLGLSLAGAWLDAGAPSPFVLAELGPGRGTLMADALRATHKVPGFHAAARIHLVEVSPSLRAAQAKALAGADPTWVDQVADLPKAPLFVIANEFFDALPIRQFLRDGPGWRERVVGVENDALVFGLTDAAPIAGLDDGPTQDGDLVQTCAAAEAIMAEVARRIATHGGTALIIDYGDTQITGDTFQAIHAGQKSDPLAHPGAADLTAHVDFGALSRAARAAGAGVHGPVAQGRLLERLGIDLRAAALAKTATDPRMIDAAHLRLTDPAEMGDLFKAIAVTPPDTAAPPGFAS
ncbi:MAG: SAM-dependent methyltransferase [Pseudomonadota bacterium]